MAEVAARRRPAHADPRPHRHARGQPVHLRQAALRPDQGLQADLAARQGAEPVRRPPRRAGEEPEGVRRPGQGQAGPAQLRLGRQRQRRPPGVRVPEDGRPTPSSSTCRTAAPGRSSPTCSRAGCRPPRSARRRSCSSSRPASCAASPPGRRSASPQLPDVPTVAEQGWPRLRDDAVVRPARAGEPRRRRRPTSSPPRRRAR